MCKITINYDQDKKAAVQKILRDLGISMTEAISLYLDAIIKNGDMPKEVDPFYSEDNLARLKRAC